MSSSSTNRQHLVTPTTQLDGAHPGGSLQMSGHQMRRVQGHASGFKLGCSPLAVTGQGVGSNRGGPTPPTPCQQQQAISGGAVDSNITLWQFLLELLTSNEHNSLIQWTNNEGEFKVNT
uniref:ETS domain-containing protein n=1 Tax=Ditylenchus dipsaci TaxID=166011 RepID=A0A915D2W3_9BILA